jgi:hypothetical protein
MKRIFVIGLAALVLLPAVDCAFAQEDEWLSFPYRVAISLKGGIGMPLRPDVFNDLWNAAFPVSLGLNYVIIPHFEVKGWLTYANWSLSEIPAKDAIGIGGVTEISGGSVNTLLYGLSGKIVPFPKSRMTPYIELGGGYFNATGEDLTITQDGATVVSNSMESSSGPVFLGVFGMEYGFNERWNVCAEFDYYIGFTDLFAPGDLLRDTDDPPTEGSDLHIATVMLGIILKI